MELRMQSVAEPGAASRFDFHCVNRIVTAHYSFVFKVFVSVAYLFSPRNDICLWINEGRTPDNNLVLCVDRSGFPTTILFRV